MVSMHPLWLNVGDSRPGLKRPALPTNDADHVPSTLDVLLYMLHCCCQRAVPLRAVLAKACRRDPVHITINPAIQQ